eukprot:g14096.t1
MEISMRLAKREEASGDGPILACFPAGAPQLKQAGGAGAVDFQLLANQNPAKASQRLLVGLAKGSGEQRYKGQNFGVDSVRAASSSFAIGIFQPGKKSANVLELHLVPNVFPLRPVMEEPAPAPSAAPSQTDTMTKRKLLAESFGSKKASRVIKKQMASKVDLQEGSETTVREVSALLAATAQQPAIEEGAVQSAIRANLLPDYDLEAQTPDKVYRLYPGVLTEAEWLAIPSAHLLNPASTVRAAHSRFVSASKQSLLGAPAQAAAKSPRKRTAKLLQYTQYMINLAQSAKLGRGLGRSDLWHNVGCPEAIRTNMILRFSEAPLTSLGTEDDGDGHRGFSAECKSKLMAHLVVFALASHSYCMTWSFFEELCADLKMGAAKLGLYFKEAGATVVKSKHVKLSAPLVLPSLPKRRSRNE